MWKRLEKLNSKKIIKIKKYIVDLHYWGTFTIFQLEN